MRKFILYIMILSLLCSCKSQQIAVNSLCGIFEGAETLYYVELKLNQDSTCSLRKIFDMSKIECIGEWAIFDNNLIKISCNKNPVLSDMEMALQGGRFIEGNIEIHVLNKNKLKLNNIVLKRKH